MTRPWRFHVFTGAGRERLAQAYEAAAKRLHRDPARARARAFEAPVMIAVSCIPDVANNKVKLHEEEFATAAAIENLMLALAALGVGSIWTTGELVTGPELAETLSLREPQSKVVGMVYVGYADRKRRLPPREMIDHSRFATWINT
jgi:nitroreductase